jgi:hypothetical protein
VVHDAGPSGTTKRLAIHRKPVGRHDLKDGASVAPDWSADFFTADRMILLEGQSREEGAVNSSLA